MKLGTETASFTNHLMARSVLGQPEPTVGMGATILCWTDRHAATIVAVDGTLLTVQEDTAKVVRGSTQDGSAVWAYEPNPQGSLHRFRMAKDGRWDAVRRNEITGRWNKAGGSGLHLGVRSEYYDPSF